MSPPERAPALLVTADGVVFAGEAAGASRPIATGELVFNTAMSGYQEVITDPSYAGQVVAFTNTHIGNYGTNGDDDEAPRPRCEGVVVRDLTAVPSNWRSTEGLEAFLVRHGLAAITGVDTRRLTRHLRRVGAIPCAFGTAPEAELRAAAAAAPTTDGLDLVSGVTATTTSTYGDGPLRIVAFDFGVKATMVRRLAALGRVTVVPAGTTAAAVRALAPDGVDAALDILDGAPVVKKAIARHLKIPFATGGAIPAGSRQILDGVWTSAPPEEILAAGRDAFLKFPTRESFMLWMHWGPVQKLKDMAYSLQGDVYLSPNAIYHDGADDERCGAWSAEIISKLKPISNGSQMNDENMPFNKGPYLSKEASARLEEMRAKYDPQRRFVSFLT